MKTVVAIDGPGGSGKSSVSREAARELGFDYLDSGAAYRALAWRCLDEGIDTLGPSDVIESLDSFDFSLGIDPERYFARVASEDVTGDIREPRVSAVVSAIARIPEVRTFMVDLFRAIIRSSSAPGIIVEGRDITTVVAPDAEVRILLTASEEVRSARRAAELSGSHASGSGPDLRRRDAQDMRVVDFMNAAQGVTTIDSTNLDFDETVRTVVDLVRSTTEGSAAEAP